MSKTIIDFLTPFMYNINELAPLEEELSKASKKGMKIGLVPTMGALQMAYGINQTSTKVYGVCHR